jgi:hypothetical protein
MYQVAQHWVGMEESLWACPKGVKTGRTLAFLGKRAEMEMGPGVMTQWKERTVPTWGVWDACWRKRH